MTDYEKMWNEAAAPEFEPLPAGQYHAQVSKATLVEATADKPGYVNWEYTITDSDYEGKKVWERNTLTEKGIYFLRRNVEEVLGVKLAGFKELPGVLMDSEGTPVVLKVTQRTYNGKVYNNASMEQVIQGEQDVF